MIKLSVIVPVYNVENYIRECLDSIVNQTLKEIEIICVDDCSTDNSYSILEEYSKKDSRVKIFRNSENIGSGPSRNIGIRKSIGEYIGFIDSDDYISNNYFELLYNTGKKYNSDMVNTLNIYIKEDNKIYEKHCHINNHLKSKKLEENCMEGISFATLQNHMSYTSHYLYETLTNKIFRRDFLIQNNLFYMEIQSGYDDIDLFYRIMLHNPKISFNHHSIYYNRVRKDSQMGSLKTDFKAAVNTISLMENTIFYTKEHFPEMQDLITVKVFQHIHNRFNQIYNKLEFYFYLRSFVEKIQISNLSVLYPHLREEYVTILSSQSYGEYVYKKYSLIQFKEMNYKIKEMNYKIKVTESSNDIKLFGIKNTSDYIIIIFFGIKIALKKNRTEQNRTEQNRTEQNRTEQNR